MQVHPLEPKDGVLFYNYIFSNFNRFIITTDVNCNNLITKPERLKMIVKHPLCIIHDNQCCNHGVVLYVKDKKGWVKVKYQLSTFYITRCSAYTCLVDMLRDTIPRDITSHRIFQDVEGYIL